MTEKLPKTLLLTLEYPPTRGGVARYYSGLVNHWLEPITLVSEKSELFWWLWPKWLPLLWRIGKRVKKEGFEMVWVGQVLPLGYVALWLKKRYKTPYAVFTHGMDILLPQASWWKKGWLKRILGQAAVVVANSEFTKSELLKLGVPEEKIVIVYPCPSLNKEQGTKNKEQASEKIVLSVGRLVKRKGFEKVIEIMPRLLKRVPGLKYVVVGNGPEVTSYKLQVTKLGLDNNVLILTDVGDTDLIQWYQRANVFVMPCEQLGADVEGFGLVFLEAAGYGLPVVVGRSGGAPEATQHGYGGFVIDPSSEDDLYQALLKILTDNSFAARLGKYGQEWVKKNFQWNNEIKKLEEKLKEL